MAAKKVMLVPPDLIDTMRRRDAITNDPVKNLQIGMDREMEQILRDTTMSPHQKIEAYNAVLSPYLHFMAAEGNKAPPLPTKVAATTDLTTATVGDKSSQTDATSTKLSSVIDRLPVKHRNTAQRLLNLLRFGFPNLHWDDYDGSNVRVGESPVQQANMVSWLNYIMKQRSSSVPPPAVADLVQLLAGSDIDPSIIPNVKLRQQVKQQKTPSTKRLRRISGRRRSGIPVLKRRRLSDGWVSVNYK